MAKRIYNETFSAYKYWEYEDEEDVRDRALKDLNDFFIDNDSDDTVHFINIFESWNKSKDRVELTVYFTEDRNE